MQTAEDRVPKLSLQAELGQLRLVASRLGRGQDEELIQEAILGISLHFRQAKETHAQEVAQLRDEIRVLHEMLAQREDSNSWRLMLQGRADIEESVRKVLAAGGRCKAVVVPVPSPLRTGAGLVEMGRFLAELHCATGHEGMVRLWTAKLAIILRTAGEGEETPHIPALPESFQLNGTGYLVRARAWEIASSHGERGEHFLKRVDERGKS